MLLWVLLAVSLVLVVAGLAVIGRLAFRLAGEVRHFGRVAGDAHERIGRAAEDLRDAVDPYEYGTPSYHQYGRKPQSGAPRGARR